ncbi:mitochondrial carrier [Exidia glandulosa HHB12029]|uniref:Mitochondrial carrier n=1 Tax=Exidia glandulosa HHB12029 TaxID=1314781 RepID=A0A165PM43_EXIGL|nr:mitochondrial carrier [Exidia glandulosa HHB12029]
MSGRPASLRDLYTSPSTQWDFTPSPSSSGPSSSSSPSAAASSSKAAAAAASQKIEWGAPRPTQSPVFDLSPSIGDDPGDIDLRVVVKSLIASAVLRYATSAIAMPWEVSKLLLQVQWMPRVPDVPEVLDTEVVDDEEEDEMTESLSESYFRDPSDPSTSRAAPRVLQRERPLVKKPVVEPLEYVIPVGKADGVWGMIRRISGSRQEGWLSLWKGLLTSCLNDVLSAYLQRHLHHLFQLVIPGPSIYGPVASHLITGVILSPLDLVRTRLIVQSSMPEHRTYRGPLDALSQIIDHEGGLTGLYLHPHLLFPAILDNALRPLISLFLPSFIGRVLGINEDTHPVAWALTEFVSSCAGLLITLPFETVRRRLQIQTRGGRHLRACVETRPRPYAGVLDTLYRIVAEERSDVPMPAAWTLRPTGTGGEQTTAVVKEELGWLAGTGIGQLYRGFGTGVVASAIVMLLAILAGDDGEAGWAEL